MILHVKAVGERSLNVSSGAVDVASDVLAISLLRRLRVLAFEHMETKVSINLWSVSFECNIRAASDSRIDCGSCLKGGRALNRISNSSHCKTKQFVRRRLEKRSDKDTIYSTQREEQQHQL